MRVAISGMGSVTSQNMLRAVRRSHPSAWILGLDADPWAVGLYQSDAQALVPAASDPAFIPRLLAHLMDHRIDLFVPGVDPELLPVAQNRTILESSGTLVLSSSPEVVRMGRDKEATYKAFLEAGLPFVRTWSLAAFMADPPKDSWPVIVKPRSGSGSKGVSVAFRIEDLASHPSSGDDIVQEYLVPTAWGIEARGRLTGQDLLQNGRLRQEDEIGVQGVVAPDGSLVGLSACWHEHRNGIPWKSYCFSDTDIDATATAVFQYLAAKGLRGSGNIQGRITEKGLVLYEINPRFAGNTAMRSRLGFDEFSAIVDLYCEGRTIAQAKAHLCPDLSQVCLRYVAEELVPREAVERWVHRAKHS